jgi:hypothetical protein
MDRKSPVNFFPIAMKVACDCPEFDSRAKGNPPKRTTCCHAGLYATDYAVKSNAQVGQGKVVITMPARQDKIARQDKMTRYE